MSENVSPWVEIIPRQRAPWRVVLRLPKLFCRSLTSLPLIHSPYITLKPKKPCEPQSHLNPKARRTPRSAAVVGRAHRSPLTPAKKPPGAQRRTGRVSPSSLCKAFHDLWCGVVDLGAHRVCRVQGMMCGKCQPQVLQALSKSRMTLQEASLGVVLLHRIEGKATSLHRPFTTCEQSTISPKPSKPLQTKPRRAKGRRREYLVLDRASLGRACPLSFASLSSEGGGGGVGRGRGGEDDCCLPRAFVTQNSLSDRGEKTQVQQFRGNIIGEARHGALEVKQQVFNELTSRIRILSPLNPQPQTLLNHSGSMLESQALNPKP